jgi:hypothetical protein
LEGRRHDKIILTILIIKDPQKAGLKPSMENPSPNCSESQDVMLSIIAFMMKVKRPSESMSRGKVRNFTNGFIKLFIKPKIRTTRNIPHHEPE